MSAFQDTFRREIRRFGDHRTLLYSGVVIPVVLTVLYVLMFTRGTVHDLPVAVWDGDKTELSRQLIRMLDATPTVRITLHADNPAQGRQAILEGECEALIIIPSGLEKNIYSPTSQAQLAAEISGARILSSGLLRRDITTVFQAFNIGITTQLLGSQGIPALQGYQIAYPVAFESHILFNPYGSYAYYLLPALLPMLLLLTVIVTTAYALGTELRYSTAGEWLATAGGSITRALTAKMLPYLLLFCLLSLLMNTLLYRYMGLPFSNGSIGIVILGNLFVILAYMSIGIMLVAASANMRFALSIGGGYTTASLSFSGLTFPSMAMYPSIAMLAKFFPFTYYIDLFIDQSMRGAPPGRSLGDLAAMGAFILLSVAFIPRLKKVTADPKYYGRT